MCPKQFITTHTNKQGQFNNRSVMGLNWWSLVKGVRWKIGWREWYLYVWHIQNTMLVHYYMPFFYYFLVPVCNLLDFNNANFSTVGQIKVNLIASHLKKDCLYAWFISNSHILVGFIAQLCSFKLTHVLSFHLFLLSYFISLTFHCSLHLPPIQFLPSSLLCDLWLLPHHKN